MCECGHYPKEIILSLSLSLAPSLFKQKEEVVRPKTRAGPHERRNEKTGREDGTNEMVRWWRTKRAEEGEEGV